MKKILILCLAAIMAMLCLAGCGEEAKEESTLPEGDLARVDEEIINAEQVREYMELFAFSQGSSVSESTDDASMSSIMMVVLDNMIEQKILDHCLQEAGIDVMSGRQSDLEEYKDNILKDEKMKAKYEKGEITDEGIEFIFKTQYYASDFYDLMAKEKNLTDKEMKEYYDSHQDDMKRTIVDAAHIMVTDENLANEIYDKIVNQGADFAELAKEYSVDINTKEEGGELGEFGKNETLPAFEEAVFALEPGDISKPVLTDLGYHIIKLNKKYQKLLDYDICKPYIENLLISDACSQILGDKMNSNVEYLYKK